MNANTAKINSLLFLFVTTPKMKLYFLEYLKFIFLFIYIIYAEIPVQHSWFKWTSVQNNMNKK